MKYNFSCENDDVTLKYKDKEFTFKRDVKFNSYIEGYDLCNLMNYLIQPNRDSSIFKSGSYVKKKVK